MHKSSFAPVLSAILLSLSAASITPAEVRAAELQQFWTSEYDRLSDRIGKAGKESVPVLKDGSPKLKGRPSLPYHDVRCLIWDTDRDPVDIVLRRTRALWKDINTLRKKGNLSPLEDAGRQLDQLEARGKGAVADTAGRRKLFAQACRLRRTIAHANPLLNFDKIIFVACGAGLGTPDSHARPGYWQYMAFNSLKVKGQGLTVISDWKSEAPKVRAVAPARQREGFRFHSTFDLSFDGKEVLFAAQTLKARPSVVPWKEKITKLYDRGEGPVHIFKSTLDGKAPVQVTRKGYNNGFPIWLPSGRVVYISDYFHYPDGESFNSAGWGRGGDRCGGWATRLWSMKSDGTDAFPISWHETPEYQPALDWNGKLVYSRWDYIDRGLNVAHNLWTCFPDGRDPRAPHGNYPYQHHTLETGPPSPVRRDGRGLRPLSEINIRPIPGSPGKYTASAGAHHHVMPGVPIMIDTNVADDNLMSQVKMLAGTDLPHESQNGPRTKLPDAYYTPWPLSEDYYLLSRKTSVLLADKFGNEILVLAWPEPAQRGYPLSARPLRPRTMPRALPTLTWQGERRNAPDHKRATIFLANVYASADRWPKGTRIKRLRILQYIQRPFNPPEIPGAFHVIKRVVLGSVPVETDGSAYFEAPVERLIYFQALDENNLAVQSMRSGTYLHPGEQMTCLGCHEKRVNAPAPTAGARAVAALKRAPSKIQPECSGSNPLSYKKLVYDDVFQKKCLACHLKKNKGLRDFTFEGIDEWTWKSRDKGALMKYLWRCRSRDGVFDPVHGGHRNIPGRFGARESGLGKLMLGSHRKRITDEEFHRVMLWLDANSVYSSQMPGRTHPLLGYDPKNRTGVEAGRPLP